MYTTREIRSIIFDLDDTLLDWSGHRSSWGELNRPHLELVHAHLCEQGWIEEGRADTLLWAFMEACDRSWSAIDTSLEIPSFEETLAAALELLHIPSSQLDMRALARVFNWSLPAGVHPFGDTLEVLETLRARGYRLGLITNSILPMWMRRVELEAFGMEGFFDVTLSSGDVGVLKPHPRIFLTCLEQLGVRADQAIYVGDSPLSDIEGAQGVGLLAALHIPRRPRNDLGVSHVAPDFTLTRLRELLAVLSRMDALRTIVSSQPELECVDMADVRSYQAPDPSASLDAADDAEG